MLVNSSLFPNPSKISVVAETSVMDIDKSTETEIELDDTYEPLVDFSNFFVKPDHFEGIYILDKIIEGVPNYRQLPGFPIYGLGQPTKDGLLQLLNMIKNGQENQKMFWFVMRQEPVVYINGCPYSPRHERNPHQNIKIKLSPSQISEVGRDLARYLKEKCSHNDKHTLAIHVDKEFSENPLDREDTEEMINVETVEDMDSLLGMVRDACNVNLEVINVPAVEDNMPSFQCFDMIVERMVGEPASTPCIFSCQSGKGRTTTGMLVAALIKEISITRDLR